MKKKVSLRSWLSFIIIGLAGQFAWCIENMYLNKFIFYLDGSENYLNLISITVALSAITAALTTIFIGGLIDKIGHRKLIISLGYILWGISTFAIGFISKDNISYLFPTANVGTAAGISVIVLDCVMTFFGSSANDACFNSYVTREVDNDNRGKVEGVLSILPLAAMLVIFVAMNGLTEGENPSWDIFFYIIGGIVIAVGIISFFLLPKEQNTVKPDNYLKIIINGFRLKTIKENKLLYITLIAYMIYGISSNVFFPYLMIYFEYSLEISGMQFSLVLGLVLIIGSILSVLYGILSDKMNKIVALIPTTIIYIIGLFLLIFVKEKQYVFAIISGILMMFGYISLSSTLNAIVRDNIPKDEEGSFMGIRMLFVVMIPMCTGPFIGSFISSTWPKGTYTEYGADKPLPSSYIWLGGLLILLLIFIPIIFMLILNKKNHKNNGLLSKKDDAESKVDDVPLKDYPRINLVRNSYISLNGKWDILINKSLDLPSNFENQCLVPYAIESKLSGVNHLLEEDEVIHYHKIIDLKKYDFKDKRLALNFEGVDCEATIYINKKEVFKHIGGYTRFSIDIEKFVEEQTFEIDVTVIDKTSLSPYSKGKQSLNRGGIWYTSTSGIYKPVWLEITPNNYMKSVLISPLFDENEVNFIVKTDKKEECFIEFLNYKIKGFTNEDIKVKVKNLPVWDINNPKIISVKVTTKEDEVQTYFGFRKVSINKVNNFYYVMLNNKPVFMNGLLDQGYYYEGNLTPKSYEDYLNDIKNIKELGFNTIRVHIKNELDMFYYYCDINGILVIQDIVSGGNEYKKSTMTLGGLFPNYQKVDDHNYKRFSREDEKGRNEYKETLISTLENDYNFPSIIMYTLFNEGWGQFDSKEIYELARKIDSSRVYDKTSGWYDCSDNEIKSIHSYFYPLKIKKTLQKPIIFTEFGGYSYLDKSHFYGNKTFGYRHYKNVDKLESAYKKLYLVKIMPLISKGLGGTIYTQLNDVEDEVNGIYTFDRILKIDKELIIKINKDLNEKFLEITKEN